MLGLVAVCVRRYSPPDLEHYWAPRFRCQRRSPRAPGAMSRCSWIDEGALEMLVLVGLRAREHVQDVRPSRDHACHHGCGGTCW